MRNRLVIAIAALLAIGSLLASTVPASASADRGRSNITAGVVRLDGEQEPLGGDADGRGTFGFLAFDSKLCYFLTARRIATPTAAHIHVGPPGVNGPIVVGLITPTQGFSADCITAQPDTTPNTAMVLVQSELDQIIANPAGFYANVHNAEFPVGAIRGQLR